jgi:hypothetical protein
MQARKGGIPLRKHYMALNCTQAETEYRLKQQLRISPPKGIVEENHFKIYKRTPGVFHGSDIRDTLFCFYGDYQQAGKCTYLAYRIRPGFSIFLMYTMLSLLMLLTMYDVISRAESLTSLLIPLSFFLFYFLIIQVQKKKCIADFEKQLTTEIHYSK